MDRCGAESRADFARISHRWRRLTNIPFLGAVLAHPDFVANRISTGFIDAHAASLVGMAQEFSETSLFEANSDVGAAAEPVANGSGPAGSIAVPAPLQGHARRDRSRGG